jgi:uncharacterized protein (DUF362 family)
MADTFQELVDLAHSEGGWGYCAGQPPHIEPTCLALLALHPDKERFASAVEAGRHYLASCRQSDGSFRLARGRPDAVWGTAMALFVETVYREFDALSPEQMQSAQFLLGLEGRVIKADPEVADMVDIDMGLVGWPWAEGTFSWVEPTSWACLALSAVGQGNHPRVQQGRKLLLDRAFDAGGINYGNRMILGRMTEPIPGPSALMLLALCQNRDQPRIRSAVHYLCDQLEECHDLEHLGWGRLALDCFAENPEVAALLPVLEERILFARDERKSMNWMCPSPPREALTALALACPSRNPFRARETNALPIAPAAPRSAKRPLGERIKSSFQSLVIRGVERFRALPAKSEVHIAPVADYDADLVDVLTRQFEHFRADVPLAGKRVVLKPNLVEYHRDKVINTDPRVIAAVIELCQREGAAEVIVAEGPGHWRNLEYLASASGLGDVLRHYKTRLVDLNHDEPVKTPNLGQLTGLPHLYLTRTITSADVFISLPKLKTHHWAGATLSLKNLFGTLPGICYGWPKNELHWRGIPNSIIDIALTQTPHLAIVDAIIGMEGDGPLNGTARQVGALVMGTDLVAVDATCCRLMGLPAERIAHLALGQMKRLGRLAESEIVQLGDSIAKFAQPFQRPPRFDNLLIPQSA